MYEIATEPHDSENDAHPILWVKIKGIPGHIDALVDVWDFLQHRETARVLDDVDRTTRADGEH